MVYLKCDECSFTFKVRHYIYSKHDKFFCPKCESIYNHAISLKEYKEGFKNGWMGKNIRK